MSKKIIAVIIVAAVVLAGTGAGLGTYFFMKNNNEDTVIGQTQESATEQENANTTKNPNEEILNEIEKMHADLDSQTRALDEKIKNMEDGQKTSETGDTVDSTQSGQGGSTVENANDDSTGDSGQAEIITQSEEEAYINELESELEDYYSMYEDAEELIDQTEVLLEDLDAALSEAEQIYDEVGEEAQAAIDEAMQHADEFEQNLSQFVQASVNFKAQYDSLKAITDLRSELLQIQQNGTNPEKLAALKEYFIQLASTMDVMAGMDLNQLSADFVSSYFARIPDYLNLKPLTGVFESLNSFQIPSIELPGIDLPDIELPGFGK